MAMSIGGSIDVIEFASLKGLLKAAGYADATVNEHIKGEYDEVFTPYVSDDFQIGPDGAYGGNDDSNHVTTIPNSSLSSGNWIGIDIPFSAMPGLSSRSKLAQVIFEGTSISNFYADNIYLRN
jgi:hypothetical protein